MYAKVIPLTGNYLLEQCYPLLKMVNFIAFARSARILKREKGQGQL
jgi:hypothetical protein